MSVSVQSVLNTVSIVGGVSAIGLPVAMSSIDGVASQSVSLTECGLNNHTDLSDISYGEKEVREVCGFAQPSNSSQSLGRNSEEFSSLFKEQWRKENEQDRDWSLEVQGKGKQQCEEETSPGNVFSAQAGIEYLGLCRKEDLSKIPFVKKQKIDSENQRTLKFGICNGDCGSSTDTKIGNSTMLQQEKKDKGKEVSFKKKR